MNINDIFKEEATQNKQKEVLFIRDIKTCSLSTLFQLLESYPGCAETDQIRSLLQEKKEFSVRSWETLTEYWHVYGHQEFIKLLDYIKDTIEEVSVLPSIFIDPERSYTYFYRFVKVKKLRLLSLTHIELLNINYEQLTEIYINFEGVYMTPSYIGDELMTISEKFKNIEILSIGGKPKNFAFLKHISSNKIKKIVLFRCKFEPNDLFELLKRNKDSLESLELISNHETFCNFLQLIGNSEIKQFPRLTNLSIDFDYEENDILPNDSFFEKIETFIIHIRNFSSINLTFNKFLRMSNLKTLSIFELPYYDDIKYQYQDMSEEEENMREKEKENMIKTMLNEDLRDIELKVNCKTISAKTK